MLQQAVTFNSHVCDFTPVLFMTLLCTEHKDKYYLHKFASNHGVLLQNEAFKSISHDRMAYSCAVTFFYLEGYLTEINLRMFRSCFLPCLWQQCLKILSQTVCDSF